MTNILKTEFFRLKKSALFWALFGVCAALPLLSVLLNMFVVMLQLSESTVEFNAWELMRNSDVTVLFLSDLPRLAANSLFALICTSIFLSKEFSGGTFRNMLLANRSRREVYLSFLLMSVTISCCYMGASFVSTLLFSGAIFGFGTVSAAKVVAACVIALAMSLISEVFLQTMMCMFMFSTRKLAVALACPLVITIIVPSFVISFVGVFAEMGFVTATDMSWIPLYNLSLLDLTAIDGALIGKILLYLIPLTVLFGVIGWFTFRKADLK